MSMEYNRKVQVRQAVRLHACGLFKVSRRDVIGGGWQCCLAGGRLPARRKQGAQRYSAAV